MDSSSTASLLLLNILSAPFLVVHFFVCFSFPQGETDVLGCNVENSSIINVVDTWNPLPNRDPNEADVTNSSLCVYETLFADSRITCQ